MKLHFKKVGNGKPLIILHGLFGSSDNWITIAKTLGEHHSVYLVDQRNHGRSPHSAEFDYQLMSDDLLEFITTHQLENPVILGHSMGGKTAMTFATQHPGSLSKLIVVDIAPKAYPVHHDQIIKGLYSLNFATISSRIMAEEQLSKYISVYGVRQFLLKNLYRTPEGNYGWRMNLDSIAFNIEKVGADLADDSIYNGKTLFLRGGTSDYILDSDAALLEQHFPNSSLVTIEQAGHWVHAEAPEALIQAIHQFLED